MLAKYVPGDIKYIFTKFYRHISTNNGANRKFVILISNLFMGCDNPNNPVVIFTLPLVAALASESVDRGRSIIQVRVVTF